MMITTTFTPGALPPPVDLSPIVATNKVPKRKRSVSFNHEVHVKYCLHHKNYTAGERRRTWLTMDELSRMKYSNRKLAMEFSRNTPTRAYDDNENDCLRGLEGRTAQGLVRRKRIKTSAKRAVFYEQKTQKRTGIVDAESLADVYFEYTEYPQVEAHMVALRDETVAALLAAAKSEPPSPSSSTPLPSPSPLPSTSSFRRKALYLSCVPHYENSTRSPYSISSLTSSRRLLTDKFFKV
jgi:hypothetical protein